MAYKPSLVVYGTPAYCAGGKWIVLSGEENAAPRVVHVLKVERPWRERDELIAGNGSAPCLLYVYGEKWPWYVENGHETVGVLSLPRGADDFG